MLATWHTIKRYSPKPTNFHIAYCWVTWMSQTVGHPNAPAATSVNGLIPMASPKEKLHELSLAIAKGGCCPNECSKAAAGSSAID